MLIKFPHKKRRKPNFKLTGKKPMHVKVADENVYDSFEIEKNISTNGINRITFVATTNVSIQVSATDGYEVSAHLYGSNTTSSNTIFNIVKKLGEIVISVDAPEAYQNEVTNKSVFTDKNNTIHSEQLVLSVKVPKETMNSISFYGRRADIILSSSLFINEVNIEIKSGSAKIFSNFTYLSANVRSTEIFVKTKATNDIDFDITSLNSNINIYTSNIGSSSLTTESKKGSCSLKQSFRGEHNMSGFIVTRKGNIKIR